MQRRAELLRGSGRLAGGDVVHLAVGDHHDRGEPLPRDVRHRAAQRGEQFGAVVAAAGLGLAGADHSEIEVAFVLQPLAQRGQRRLAGLLAVTDLLARRFVEDDDRDIAQRRALLLDQRRVDQDRQQHRQRQGAP